MDEELWLILVCGLWNDKEMAQKIEFNYCSITHLISPFLGASKHPIYSVLGARNF